MRRIVTIIISVIMGAALTVPNSHAESVEPDNSFCIYGVAGMHISIEASKPGIGGYSYVFDYDFPSGSSHYNNPYVISNSVISEWYSHGVTQFSVTSPNSSAITLTSPDAIISDTTSVMILSDDGTPLSLVTKILAIKRMYLFPIGSAPNIAGVTPTPFVNDGSDIVVDDNELKNTINAISEFQPLMQFIFKSVIPWAGVAGVIILVFATIRLMLRG